MWIFRQAISKLTMMKKTISATFTHFFSPHLYKTIAEAIAIQTTGSSTITITEKDVEEFIVIELMMGIIKLPAYTDYWATDKRIS